MAAQTRKNGEEGGAEVPEGKGERRAVSFVDMKRRKRETGGPTESGMHGIGRGGSVEHPRVAYRHGGEAQAGAASYGQSVRTALKLWGDSRHKESPQT